MKLPAAASIEQGSEMLGLLDAALAAESAGMLSIDANPTAPMLEMARAEYEPLYRAILARLDPRRVVGDLHRLADPHEPILLCWERSPFSETVWCHRRRVAAWLERELGLVVPEIAPRPTGAAG